MELVIALAVVYSAHDGVTNEEGYAFRQAALATYLQTGTDKKLYEFTNKYIDRDLAGMIEYSYSIGQMIIKKEVTYGWKY